MLMVENIQFGRIIINTLGVDLRKITRVEVFDSIFCLFLHSGAALTRLGFRSLKAFLGVSLPLVLVAI